ncbi:MAG: class I SAM-dependent methyltransferase [Solirubrobacteraceae bacterium]
MSAEITTGVRSVLSKPTVYELFSRAIGGHRARMRLVREHLRIAPGSRVLDVGCGPGELLSYLGDVQYVGIDISASYVKRARKRFAARTAEFFVGDATSIPTEMGDFDVAVATGVMHHLDDAQVREMVGGIAEALKLDGRFICLENAVVPGQHRIARAIIARDRGQHVRSPEGYAELAGTAFGSVHATIRHDLLRIPYTHCVLECREPAGS